MWRWHMACGTETASRVRVLGRQHGPAAHARSALPAPPSRAATCAAACPRVQMYMLPEGHASGALRLYVAEAFPLHWRLHSVLLQRPMIDASLAEWRGRWYLFASDVVGGRCTPVSSHLSGITELPRGCCGCAGNVSPAAAPRAQRVRPAPPPSPTHTHTTHTRAHTHTQST